MRVYVLRYTQIHDNNSLEFTDYKFFSYMESKAIIFSVKQRGTWTPILDSLRFVSVFYLLLRYYIFVRYLLYLSAILCENGSSKFVSL